MSSTLDKVIVSEYSRNISSIPLRGVGHKSASIYDIIGHIKDGDEIVLPFINYYLESYEGYEYAQKKYVDWDNDFRIGASDGILMNMDFVFINTNQFSEVADYFTKHKRYCDYTEDTIEYVEFWKRETQRRRKGMVANCKLLKKDIPLYFDASTSEEVRKSLLKPLRITGTHYAYLNYGRIDRTRNEQEKIEAIQKGLNPKKTIEGFARFWDGDYWKFKLDEFCDHNDLNSCDSKARRKGFTFKESEDSANMVNLNKNTYVIHAAYDADEYLLKRGKLTHLTKRNLDWYENHTYWKRGYIKEELSNIITGYKLTDQGNKWFGDQSSIDSVSLRTNTSAAAGSTAAKVKFEEAGINAVLKESVGVTMSTNEVGAVRVGNLRIFGTGGTKGANWNDFSEMYYNPDGYNMLAMENIWDTNRRASKSGFFFPQIWNYEPYIDDYGNSKIIDAYYHDKADKINKAKTLKGEEYLLYIGQRANKPEEAFLNTIENIFTRPELQTQLNYLKYSDDAKCFEDGLVVLNNGRYIFKTNTQLNSEGTQIYSYIEDVPFKTNKDNTGCLRIFQRPIRTLTGDVPDDLYFISYDTVKVDKKKTEITHKHSLNSFKVWKCPNNLTNDNNYRIVASYCGRFATMEETDRLVLGCCEYYNCKVLFEYGSGDTVHNFRQWGKLNRLLRDPSNIVDGKETKSEAGFGMVMGDSEKKLNGLTYLCEWLYSNVATDTDGNFKYNLHYIPDLPFILELSNFNGIDNFDRISDAILAMYYIKARVITKATFVTGNTNKRALSSILKTMSI